MDELELRIEIVNTDPLIAAALLGTNRMGSLPPPPDASLEVTWSAIPREDPAEALLQALVMMRALHKAGVRTREDVGAVPEASAESRAVMPAAAVDTLMRLLRGEFVEVLPEWLLLAGASGRVLPGRVFPELLDLGAGNAALREPVRRLAGERGRWIARRYPEHGWLAAEAVPAENAWEEGNPRERLAWLRQMRVTHPALAREAVAATWTGEESGMRESILRIVAEHPLAEDEEWLELGLGDRRKEIRELAARALMNLTNSTFHRRVAARARGYVKLQRRLLRKVISLEPPVAFDPAWEKDGIKEKPPQGTGEKAWWLRQMIAQVPLAQWPGLLECEPASMLDYPIDGDWREVLLAGWVDSAMRMPEQAMSERFIPFIAALEPWPANLPNKHVVLIPLLVALPGGRKHAVLEGIAEKLPMPFMLDLISRCGELPAAGTVPALSGLIDRAVETVPAVIDRSQARALAACIPQGEILSRLQALAPLAELSSAAEEFATLLEFRRPLPASFNPLPSP